MGGFDDDVPGQIPTIGGASQPAGFHPPRGTTTVLVQEEANGISTQPLAVTLAASGLAGAYYEFPLVTDGTLRVEATIALSRTDLLLSSFFQTGVTPSDIVVTRVRMNVGGEIIAGRTPIGTIEPATPFRLRVDVDLDSQTWSASLDDELDGFENDPVFSSLSFLNLPSEIPGVGSVSLDLLGASLSASFDDILIRTLVPEPHAMALVALALALPAGYRRIRIPRSG